MNWKKQKILITGASGFVGSNATHYFSKLGAEVTAAVSPHATARILKRQLEDCKKFITIKKYDLLSPKEAITAAKGHDIILNFAAIDGNAQYKRTHSGEIFSKNMRIVLNMLEAAEQAKVKTFLLMSSADIYTQSSNRRINENSSIDIHWNKDVDGYKLAKWASELAAREFGTQYKLPIIIIRPSNLYGPRDEFENDERMRVIPSIIKKLFTTKRPIELWGDKKQTRSYLYIDDFLYVCQQIIENSVYNQPINIASKQNVSLDVLSKKIIAQSQKKRIVIDIGKEKTIKSITREFNIALLLRIIPDFREISLDEGIKKTIHFYKSIHLKSR